MDEAVLVDLVNPKLGPGARVAMELSPQAARDLVAMIETALQGGHDRHTAESPA